MVDVSSFFLKYFVEKWHRYRTCDYVGCDYYSSCQYDDGGSDSNVCHHTQFDQVLCSLEDMKNLTVSMCWIIAMGVEYVVGIQCHNEQD